jgi:hypothetical protein
VGTLWLHRGYKPPNEEEDVQDLSQFELTGEFRPPQTGEHYLSSNAGRAVVAGSPSRNYTAPRYIVRPRTDGLADATFEELTAELMRRFEAEAQEQRSQGPSEEAVKVYHVSERFVYATLGGLPIVFELVDEDERLTEEDAREAALATLTQIALDDERPVYDRMDAARTILQYGSYEL